MYILCTQYDSGHIARVVNPDAIPNRRARYGILCGGFSPEAKALAAAIIDMGGTEEQALRAAHERHNWKPAPAPSREALEAVWREGDFVEE